MDLQRFNFFCVIHLFAKKYQVKPNDISDQVKWTGKCDEHPTSTSCKWNYKNVIWYFVPTLKCLLLLGELHARAFHLFVNIIFLAHLTNNKEMKKNVNIFMFPSTDFFLFCSKAKNKDVIYWNFIESNSFDIYRQIHNINLWMLSMQRFSNVQMKRIGFDSVKQMKNKSFF